MKVIIPAGEIPLFSRVTKKTGEKEYTLRDRVRVFSETGSPTEIVATEGTRLIVNDQGDANAVPNTLELVWLVEVNELRAYLEELEHR